MEIAASLRQSLRRSARPHPEMAGSPAPLGRRAPTHRLLA